jgi:hypothetical protein
MSYVTTPDRPATSLERLAMCMYAAYVLNELPEAMIDIISSYFGKNWINTIEDKLRLKHKKDLVYARIHRYRASGLNIHDIGYRLATKFIR